MLVCKSRHKFSFFIITGLPKTVLRPLLTSLENCIRKHGSWSEKIKLILNKAAYFRFQAKVCEACHDETQKSISLDDFINCYCWKSCYGVKFWSMIKSKAVNRNGNADTIEKTEQQWLQKLFIIVMEKNALETMRLETYQQNHHERNREKQIDGIMKRTKKFYRNGSWSIQDILWKRNWRKKKQKVKEYGKNTEKLCPKKTNKERKNTWKTREKVIQAMC